MTTYAQVAVPLPLPAPLTYEIPEALLPFARPGARVRVPVGRRRTLGILVAISESAPTGLAIRPLEQVVDREPILPADLLRLGRFLADYYLAPIGEVFKAMLPGELPPWGERRVWLTAGGALGRPRTPQEERVVDALRDGGRRTLAELRQRVGTADLEAVLIDLATAGRVALEHPTRRRGRYLAAVELAPGDREQQLAACGRSAAGRAIIDYLVTLERPATLTELRQGIGCGPAPVRRLVGLGILRQFSQPEHLSLDHHLLSRPQPPIPVLRADQEEATGALVAAVAAGRFAPFLLSGVTGSGKTEVYLRAAEETIERGRSAILLVPEIALVPALARTAESRFGGRLAILHSGLGEAEREQEWERIRTGEAGVVLGPRSAVFAPVRDLGLIAVDEEQDQAYKQEISPRYHGRDVALVRCQEAGAVCALVSATPSLETRRHAADGRYQILRLRERVGQGSLPEGILVDLRQESGTTRLGEVRFSARLAAELEATLARGEQVILLRNRRGYSPLLLCRACGEDMRCAECGLPRTFHRREGRLLCHYCGSSRPVPERCPQCGEGALEAIGAGTERVEEGFSARFPGVSVAVLDRDTVRRQGSAAALLERFARGTVQVLIGTQMVSKGHHFPRVGLTAMLSADSYLGFPDFRAVERTYSLLTQLAGRAGRGERTGKVVIQTFHPDHYAIRAAFANDDQGFAAEELRFRRVFHYPPFTRMVQLLWHDRSRQRGESGLAELAARLTAHPLAREIRLSGPAPAPFERLRGQWRFQLLLRSASGERLRRLLVAVLGEKRPPQLVVDVDPYQLL